MNLVLDIPIVETERLVLREHRYSDFPIISVMWRDPEVIKYIDGKPRPEEESWLKFLRATGLWVHLGYGYWIIEEKDSGAIVGEIGFADFKREITPSMKGQPEIGWALGAPYHGKGYASEVALAAVQWADENIKERPLACIINPGNKPSIRVAEKCGFKQVGTAQYHGSEVIVFHRHAN